MSSSIIVWSSQAMQNELYSSPIYGGRTCTSAWTGCGTFRFQTWCHEEDPLV